MKDDPDHLTKAYVTAKDKTENPIEATTGAPSPWKVFTSTAMELPHSASKLHDSNRFNVEDMYSCRVVFTFKVQSSLGEVKLGRRR